LKPYTLVFFFEDVKWPISIVLQVYVD